MGEGGRRDLGKKGEAERSEGRGDKGSEREEYHCLVHY